MRAAIFGIVLFLASTLAGSTLVFAQEEPYSPQEASPGELIVTERFTEAPVVFPWPEVSSSRLAQDGRIDFELLYDVEYAEVRQTIEDNYEDGVDFVEVEPDTLQYIDVEELRIFGLDLGQRGGRITLGSPDMEPRLNVDVEPDGTRTRFIVHNTIRARQFEGFVPFRVGYLPAGADEISVDNP